MIAAVACGWICTASAIPEGHIQDAGIAHERDMLRDAILQTQQPKPDGPALEAALKAILSDSAFPELSQEERHAAYVLLGAVLFDAGKNRDAAALAAQASEMPEATDFDWDIRLRNSYALNDYRDAAHAMSVLARGWPAKIGTYRDEAIFMLAREVQKPSGDSAAASEFLDGLIAAKWKPKDPFGYPETDLWLNLLKARLERGDIAGAARAAEGLRDPVVLLKLRADKRFDAVVQAEPQRFDIMNAYHEELAARRAASEGAQGDLKDINDTADTLFNLNRPKEALNLLTEAIDRAEARPNSFRDERDQLHWSYDKRSSALFVIGRSQDAFAAMTAGSSLKELGRVNVSQAINLAGKYVVFDRPRDALDAVDSVGFSATSPYGRMALEDVHACAYFELGEKDDLAGALKYMKAHADDGMQPFLNTMLFTGDLDGAAEHVIAQLKDPAKRMDVLYFLQDYLPEPNATARELSVHANWITVRNRPDVAAAIAAVGRVESYPLMSPSY